jgi:hypothetical protein
MTRAFEVESNRISSRSMVFPFRFGAHRLPLLVHSVKLNHLITLTGRHLSIPPASRRSPDYYSALLEPSPR